MHHSDTEIVYHFEPEIAADEVTLSPYPEEGGSLDLSARRGAVARVRDIVERGMATAEYAVGILAAVALALVLLNIFKHQEFITKMLKFVGGLIGKVSGMIP